MSKFSIVRLELGDSGDLLGRTVHGNGAALHFAGKNRACVLPSGISVCIYQFVSSLVVVATSLGVDEDLISVFNVVGDPTLAQSVVNPTFPFFGITDG